jgi:hypothetical protein
MNAAPMMSVGTSAARGNPIGEMPASPKYD